MPSDDLSGQDLPLYSAACQEISCKTERSVPIDFVHIHAVQAICEILIELDVDPESIFEQAGVSTQIFSVTDAISFASLGRLTALAANHSQCAHFGLLVGQRTTLASLGLLGSLMRHSETVGDALRALEMHHDLLNRGAVVELSTDGTVAIVSYAPYEPEAEGIALHCERALAALTIVLRALCGANWSPDEVLLPRLEPPDTTPYSSFFRAPVRFGQEIAALVFPTRLLRRSIKGANPVARKTLERHIQQLEAVIPTDVTDEIRRRLRTTAIRKQINGKQFAQTMAICRRTLSRRLKAKGTTFKLIANETRLGIAKQLLGDTDMSLAQISAALEFSEPAAFTHAFRRWTGTTPSAWRKECRLQ
ncbi:AraC family transcriptional regulator [Methylobacterium nodulans]|uniref:Transcriptional regulator, AraC family n=1 Tax=Methylobacterium nodulans (strain LMG 21967 / CNCM I-2342 / ORS 2060) TaxID=460265 RepID=B8IA21_METNO|nr:AraC family transcriptional regulator [Methylobacterium nodulans]ACL57249.1 transcriptional regulator, AraC family [Methylobacterium nodulans ORS 2060]